MEVLYMSEELEVFNTLAEAEAIPDFSVPFTGNYELDQKIVEHKAWLKSIRHEQPSPKHHYRVGIYIRYFNQKNMTTTWSTTSGNTRIRWLFALIGIWWISILTKEP